MQNVKRKNKKVFWFHFNKPATLKSGKVKITLHYDKKCYIVEALNCTVPTVSKINKTQPLFVMRGRCYNITFNNNIAYIE